MAYPMHYHRVINRNHLWGGYEHSSLHGDLRRLEHDTLDDAHVAAYAQATGATEEQVRMIFQKFFYDCICGISNPVPGPGGLGYAHGWIPVSSYEE